MKPLDPDTQDRVASVVNRARRAGANIPTWLNEAGLLWTPQREAGIRVETLQKLLQDVGAWMPHEFLRLVNRELTNCTPADMHRAMILWLERYLEHARTQ